MGWLTTREVGYGLAGVAVAVSAGLILVDSLPARAGGWAAAMVGVGVASSMLLTEFATRRRGQIFGVTPEVLIPATLAGVSAALLVAHAWGWATWLA